MGEAMYVRGTSVYGKSLYFPLNFAVYLKLLYKKKSIKKIQEAQLNFNFRQTIKYF